MRDSDASPVTGESLPLAVVVQPEPTPEERPAGPFRTIVTGLGAAAIVILVLYGMTRPPEPQQMAAASDAQTGTPMAPAGGGAANSSGSQAQPATTTTKNPQQPTTTTGQGEPKGQASQSKVPPASGGPATSAVGLGAQPASEAK